jgi:hypothetical protein
MLAERLLAEGWEYLTVDPYAWNDRVIRAWMLMRSRARLCECSG